MLLQTAFQSSPALPILGVNLRTTRWQWSFIWELISPSKILVKKRIYASFQSHHVTFFPCYFRQLGFTHLLLLSRVLKRVKMTISSFQFISKILLNTSNLYILELVYQYDTLWASLVAQQWRILCNTGDTGDMGSFPGLGRSPAGQHGAHSSTLAWRIPGTEEPGGLPATGLHSCTWTGHDQGDWAHVRTWHFREVVFCFKAKKLGKSKQTMTAEEI